MSIEDARNLLSRAESHLSRVQAAWLEPTDWDDLTLYGFYGLEAAVVAAGAALGWQVKPTHAAKAAAAARLHVDHGLPDVSQLLDTLNTARKSVAYGDVQMPNLDAEDIAAEIENFVTSVSSLIDTVEAELELEDRE